jgi:hypothetical protein
MKADLVLNTIPTTGMTAPEVDNEIRKCEEISLRAYELYVERGREDGHDLEDWLQAELEVTAMRTRPIAA